jgi:predicted SAM-dependent methyltransferase
MIKLDIGSGSKATDSSFIGVDAFTEADVNALMWDLPYKDGEVDVILSAQSLEHVSKFQVIPTLREWKRVLKIGGKLEICVPDLEWACLWWLHHQTNGWDMDIIYGVQLHEGEFHKTGFTVNLMLQYLEACGGFKVMAINFWGATLEEAATHPDEVMQRVIDFEILRVDDAPVAQ